MKKIALYISIVVVLLTAGFVYLKLLGTANSPFGKADSGSPTVTTQNDNEKLVFRNYGPMPEFKNVTKWLNAEPPTIDSLKGKVVLVNFWTYSCIGCIRSTPFLNHLQETYQDQGLVIISVHTPEYAFEKVTDNVQNAVNRYGIKYPVAQDNAYSVWDAYNNQFWPANYLIDREGKIVYARVGDGGEEIIRDAIQRLVGLTGGLAVAPGEEIQLAKKSSQTLAFGLKHANVLANAEQAAAAEQVYTLPETLRRNAYALEGIWKLSDEKAALTQGYGRIRLSFSAAKVGLTAQSIKPVNIKITIDGKPQDDITVQALKNYNLFSAAETGKHTLEIEIPQPGFEASAFIFE